MGIKTQEIFADVLNEWSPRNPISLWTQNTALQYNNCTQPTIFYSALKIEKVSACRQVRAVMSYFTKCEQCIIDKCLEIEKKKKKHWKKNKKLLASGPLGNTILNFLHVPIIGWHKITLLKDWFRSYSSHFLSRTINDYGHFLNSQFPTVKSALLSFIILYYLYVLAFLQI